MPGSPPISSAEPTTSPPPHTRSNSLMPLFRRAGCGVVPVRPVNSSNRPFLPPWPRDSIAPAGPGAAPASSVMVFHSPHDSQRPLHLVVTAPHDWQTKRLRGRAMGGARLELPDLHPDRSLGAAVDELVDMGVAGA